MLERYKTILNLGTAELVEKKSKFIANVSPIETEQQAQTFINSICKKYYAAAHNVFAYQIGENNELQRCSDDGEPSGTAGKPIIDILKSEDIKNIVVVVTRYFGGTLLGTGGLVRAYSKAAKEGILNAQIVQKVLYQIFEITVDYTLNGKLQYELLKQNYIIKDTYYTDKVTFVVLIQPKDIDKFKKVVAETTSAQGQILTKDNTYCIHNSEGDNINFKQFSN